MGCDHFEFKQFCINQDRCAMKVGTDGVLLGAFAPIHDQNNIQVLDIGTGTGLISLMIAQRLAEKQNCGQIKTFHIDGIEIDTQAALQAQDNVTASPWSDKISIYAQSLQDFANDPIAENRKYDIIISNPPFYNATLKPEDEARAIARHKDSLPLIEITKYAEQHLSENGELNLIYPINYDTEVMTSVTLSRLHPITLCDVITKKGKPCKRRMATFALPSHPIKDVDRKSLIIRNEDNEYSEEYIKLVSNYYLSLK